MHCNAMQCNKGYIVVPFQVRQNYYYYYYYYFKCQIFRKLRSLSAAENFKKLFFTEVEICLLAPFMSLTMQPLKKKKPKK
jgi:hypothetical protein